MTTLLKRENGFRRVRSWPIGMEPSLDVTTWLYMTDIIIFQPLSDILQKISKGSGIGLRMRTLLTGGAPQLCCVDRAFPTTRQTNSRKCSSIPVTRGRAALARTNTRYNR